MGRRLGQHFLTNPAILQRIVGAINPRPDDTVIEIGAGRGALTWPLAKRVGHVIAIERDPTLTRVLMERRGEGEGAPALPDTVRVVEGDALEVDWHGAVTRLNQTRFKVIGNIPYYITTPLIEKALTPPPPDLIVILAQKEIADRLAAEPGGKEYGALSVGVQVAAVVERLFLVRAGAFHPPPKVDSAVVRMVPRDPPLVPWTEIPEFRRFIGAVFSQRRKQFQTVLRAVTGRDRSSVRSGLSESGIPPMDRPEMVSPQAFVRLFHWSRR